MRQANTVDLTRRSPSYELRLVKYASRGIGILIPTLRRENVNPEVRWLGFSLGHLVYR